MAIKSYPNKTAYSQAVKSAIESQVSMIETSREIIVDGVNVITTEPVPGDLLFLDESNNKVYIKGGAWIQKANIPTSWTHVGYVYIRRGHQVGVINKASADLKYADVLQYALTAITSTSLVLKLRIRDTSKSGDAQYATAIDVAVTLTSTAFDATTVAEITAALEAKATQLGDTRAWWCYLANDDNEMVEENATRIVVQCDTWNNWQEYSCGCTGGTLTFATWGDMPASDIYLKNDRGWTNYWGVMNRARTRAWATSNGRVPTSMEPIKQTGNPAPVKPSCFEDPNDAGYPYCADLRAAYGTYDGYLKNGFGVMYPQKLGTFALPGAHDLSMKYARAAAPTKAGGTKYKYPAFKACYDVSYGVDGLDFGDWYLPSSFEGCHLMADETLAILAPSISKMGTTAINNATTRWFAERCNVGSARIFYGTHGILNYDGVYGTFRVQAVTLLDI